MKAIRRAVKKRFPVAANLWGKFRWYASPKGIAKTYADVRLAIQHRGNKVRCPFCDWQGRSFYPHSAPHERPNAVCPCCWSKERHRLLYFYLIHRRVIFSRPIRILEIAPGRYSYYLFRDLTGKSYFTLDYESPLAATRGDICALPYANEAFDLVICYHVLEHVPDDSSAMQELYRILAIDGELLVQVPIEGEVTREDPSITSEEERLRLFGQEDHVRSYGRDIAIRLQNAGLKVEEVDFAIDIRLKDILYYGLRFGELTYICTRYN